MVDFSYPVGREAKASFPPTKSLTASTSLAGPDPPDLGKEFGALDYASTYLSSNFCTQVVLDRSDE